MNVLGKNLTLFSRKFEAGKKFIPVCFIFLCIIMILAVLRLSPVGSPDVPGYSGYPDTKIPDKEIVLKSRSAALYYNKNTVPDVNSMNVVSAVMLDYRAYDTLFVAALFFTVMICVLSVLVSVSEKGFTLGDSWEPSIIIKNITRIMVPYILIFGSYIILRSHLSAGNGFHGGVIIGAGFIIYTVVFGLEKTSHYAPEDTLKIMNTLSMSTLISIGISGIITGYNFLANKTSGIPPIGRPGVLLSAGTLLGINIGIGINISCSIIRMFFAFQKNMKTEGENVQ